MNEKGRQTKLLAAIAVLAMVMCVFAVVSPGVSAADENNASLVAADSYSYSSGASDYEYNGTRTIDGNAVWMTYTDGTIDLENMVDVRNDFARFMGALNYIGSNNANQVDSIIFNENEYTWDTTTPNLGSNWYNGETSLVSAAGSYLLANATELSKTGCIPMTIVVGDVSTQITYGIAGLAMVGNTIYTSLSEAVENATAGSTITVVSSNIVSNGSYPSITIDKNLTIEGQGNTYYGSFVLDAEVDDQETAYSVSINNLIMDGNKGVGMGITGQNQGTSENVRAVDLTLDNVTIQNYKSKGAYLTNIKTLMVDGCDFYNNATTETTWCTGDYALDLNVCGVTGVDITIQDSSFGQVNGGKAPLKVTQRGGGTNENKPTDDYRTDITNSTRTVIDSLVVKNCTFSMTEDAGKTPMADLLIGTSPDSEGSNAQITYCQAIGSIQVIPGESGMTVGFRGDGTTDPAIVFALPAGDGNTAKLTSTGTIVAATEGAKITGEVDVEVTDDVVIASGAVPDYMTLQIGGQNATAVTDANGIASAGKDVELIIFTANTVSMNEAQATDKTIVFNEAITSGTVYLEGNGKAVFSNSVTATITTIDENGAQSSATLSKVSGNFTISVGSIIMNGVAVSDEDGDGTINITGDAYVDGTFTVGDGITLTIADDATLEVPAGAILNINGTMSVVGAVTNNGTINNNGTTTITGSLSNQGSLYSASTATLTGADKITGNAPVGGFGISTDMDAIASNLDLTGYAFLTGDLTIPYGKSITVGNGAILDLRGNTLTVLGTLTIASNGTVINAEGSGAITIGTTGVIDNSGIIGAANASVVITLDSNMTGAEDGSVTLSNVTGLGFGYKRFVSGNDITYYLAVSGNASKRGTADGAIAIDGTVYVTDALSVNNKVTVTNNGTLVLDNNVTMTVTSNGAVNGGIVNLSVGSVLDIDGKADVTVSASTGDYRANAPSYTLSETTVQLKNIKGIEFTVTSESYSMSGALWYAQRLEMSGTMDNYGVTSIGADQSNNVPTGITIDGTVNGENYLGLVISGTLTITDDINTWVVNSGMVTVEGTVSFGQDNQIDGTDGILKNLVGTMYTIQTTTDGVVTETYYITSFETAVGNIADAYEGTLTVYGNVDVDFSFELGANQSITGTGIMTIDEEAVVTVNNDATITFGSIEVDGKLIVTVDGYVNPSIIVYEVRSIDAEYTTTYSGFAVALSEAQPGETITVERETTVDSDITIPEGVTVVVNNGATLTVAISKTGNPSDLTVNGTLTNKGTVDVSGDITVNGSMDITDGTLVIDTTTNGNTDTHTSEITVSGTLTSIGTKVDEDYVNAVQYTAENGDVIYTSLANAAEVVNAYDVNKYLYLFGTVSDSTAVTLDGITLTVNGTARLGTVTLNGATIIVDNGTYTGTVAGVSGTDGATIETSATYTGVENVQISCTSAPNSSNVDVYSYVVSAYGNPAPANITGAVAVDAGTVQVQTMTFTGDKNTLTVGANATVVIAGGNTLTAASANDVNGVTVNGTMVVNGILRVTGIMDVAGTLEVGKSVAGDLATVEIVYTADDTSTTDDDEYWAVLNIVGAMNISDVENREGTVTINGILAVGSAPTTLGVGGSVTGPIETIGSMGYIKAYAGADLTGAEILIDNTGESDTDNTVFYINGTEYMTIYAVDGTRLTYNNVLSAEEFDIVGYETYVMSNNTVSYDIQDAQYWKSDADLTQSLGTAIGSNDAAYTKVSASEVRVTVSVGEGISLYIDDIRMIGNYVILTVGTHDVYAVVDPGFTGDVSISFNGSAVSGTFTVTPEMASAAYEGTPAISATGNISADNPEIVIPGGSSSSDEMGLTDYLLIILVILIVIMAIMVAFRLMRS